MRIIRRRSTVRQAFCTLINITAIMGYIVAVALYIWFQWYTGGPK